jgi:hypothetical protein
MAVPAPMDAAGLGLKPAAKLSKVQEVIVVWASTGDREAAISAASVSKFLFFIMGCLNYKIRFF